MLRHLTSKKAIYWGLPLTLIAAATYTKTKTVGHPLQYVPSGEQRQDTENLERVRAEWRERNNGIGLRDVNRSGGGV
ncbi:uncharacterized protein BYT42DRAFT_509458 [Radiomyces spectabilis]|uniref:uncharacterized protein n=1 Tax=Radiomyces spectabilis TaxID=64574 RepID=UPI002220DADA|nr:uncharacterized protein BYT42DRAFT_509458 [Radiomyces spectabilis]KAI8391451.1 hypothetical protein BYT42DRAFT_509458 [Radiomyces spectabilis]